jgi:hypothetical protein
MREKWRHDRETSNSVIETCFRKNMFFFSHLFFFLIFAFEVSLLISCYYPSYLTINSCFVFVLLLLLILYLLILDFIHWVRLGQVSYLSPLSVRHLSSVHPLTFHIVINSSEATGPIWTKLWWNSPWMAPFQNCVRWPRLPTKMATKLKIEKRGDEILIVHCCFSISQNELKF